jgi:hypothetical protein
VFNQVLTRYFGGVFIDINVQLGVNYLVPWGYYLTEIFNQVLPMCFGGVIIDIDVELYVDCVPWCCYRQ